LKATKSAGWSRIRKRNPDGRNWQLARSGKKVMPFLHDELDAANVVDGKAK
jgi:hypothetical protein